MYSIAVFKCNSYKFNFSQKAGYFDKGSVHWQREAGYVDLWWDVNWRSNFCQVKLNLPKKMCLQSKIFV